MQIPDNILNQFPAFLSHKLRTGVISFNDNVKFEYDKIFVYRCVDRKRLDFSEITMNDFKSKAELGRIVRGLDVKDLLHMPVYYGVSSYQIKEELILRQRLPNKNRKIIKGYIQQKGGPMQLSEKDSHVCWWLYKDADISNFSFDEKLGET